MRCLGFLFVSCLAIVVSPTALHAGANSGAKAWLSWDSTSVVCDLPVMPAGSTWVYVQLGDMQGFFGCEFTVWWEPYWPSGAGCYEFVRDEHPSGSGGNCTWMMRGQQAEGISVVDQHSWVDAFAGDQCSNCSTGNVARFLLDFSSCSGNVPGRICLEYVQVNDCSFAMDALTVIGSVTVLGGVGVQCPCQDFPEFPGCPDCDWAVSVEGSTWGAVKALYK